MENFEPQDSSTTVSDGKTIAIVAYLTWIGLVIALIMNNNTKNSFAAFHIRQSIGIMLTSAVLGFVAIIPFLGWIIAVVGMILVFVMWVSSFLNALNGKEKVALFLGGKFNEWFASIK